MRQGRVLCGKLLRLTVTWDVFKSSYYAPSNRLVGLTVTWDVFKSSYFPIGLK